MIAPAWWRQDIAAEFWVGAQRSRKQRLITVGRHQVLRENNYDLASVRFSRHFCCAFPEKVFLAELPQPGHHIVTITAGVRV